MRWPLWWNIASSCLGKIFLPPYVIYFLRRFLKGYNNRQYNYSDRQRRDTLSLPVFSSWIQKQMVKIDYVVVNVIQEGYNLSSYIALHAEEKHRTVKYRPVSPWTTWTKSTLCFNPTYISSRVRLLLKGESQWLMSMVWCCAYKPKNGRI